MNLQIFKTRAITAIVFSVVMLAGLLLNKWGFIALFTLIHFGCWYEFVKLMKKINPERSFSFSLPGIFYISLPVFMMLDLGLDVSENQFQGDYLPLIPCGIVFSIWINDTMAYIVGSLIGKTQLSKISPKKTWEGTTGGAILCVVVIALLGYFIPYANKIPVTSWIAIAAICAIFGTLGDLLESKLKRLANVKDSGTFMPGHGGFLDRFDSLLIATPFVYLYLLLTLKP